MEKETLFTTSKWNILEELAKRPSAPLEIAKNLSTSIANVSQQLRLLEAAGLVQKQRLANVEAGQPRALFSLSNDFAHLSLISRGIAKKELLTISGLQIFVARVWLLNNPLVANLLTKFAYTNETLFKKMGELYFLSSDPSEIVLETISKNKVSGIYFVEYGADKVKVSIKDVSSSSEGSELLFNGETE